MEGSTCKLCGKEIEEELVANVFSKLSSIYRHFKTEHPEVIENVKAELATATA